ncbi:hypothetical protein MAR_015462 [Mya arenaria]|uniref:Uncharacterized protein n=1 Tax=Mya arenaria TaxID=6604 RepID=A0ABY7FLD8_MYAAR|nr:uncharacterized protein LOC128212529 [Mya arenaria]WAR21488.1 hypothetical protein MAR_015462 [Mya arenaria]
MNILFGTAMVCILLAYRVQAESKIQEFKMEGLPVNGTSDIMSKQEVSGSGTRNDKRVDYCGGGLYCQTGTYCCYNGGCCLHGWTCCSAIYCCAGAAGLAGSTLGQTMVILLSIAGYFVAKLDKHTFIL